MPVRAEIKLQRLLYCCDSLTANDQKSARELWRLDKYVKGLKDLLTEIKLTSSRLDHSKLTEYERKIHHFTRLLETERLTGQVDIPWLVASDHLVVSTNTRTENEREQYHRRRSKHNVMSELRSDLLKSPTPNVSFSHDPTSLSTTHTGEKPSLSSASSKLADAGASDDDADEEKQLLRERQVQAAITDELVEMARALKDTTLLAGSMVREDIETLDEVESIADRNQSKLAIEGQRLQKHMEVYASCWIWIALLNVSVVFIMMIIFIRLIPAPRF